MVQFQVQLQIHRPRGLQNSTDCAEGNNCVREGTASFANIIKLNCFVFFTNQVLQKLGKADETKDEQFEEYVQNFKRQEVSPFI